MAIVLLNWDLYKESLPRARSVNISDWIGSYWICKLIQLIQQPPYNMMQPTKIKYANNIIVII